MVIRTFSSELSDGDSIASEPFNDHYEHLHPGTHSQACAQSLSESEQSPGNTRKEWRKKRRAPPPPSGPPPPYPSPGSLRHSYSFERNNRTSTDSESLSMTYDSSRLFYQTSTDSENVPESANSTSSLTVSDHELSPVHEGQPSPLISPRDRSRLGALKNALRSPRNLRKNSKKEVKDEEGKAFRVRKNATIEPPDCSVWTLALLPDDLWDPDTEFEVSFFDINNSTACFGSLTKNAHTTGGRSLSLFYKYSRASRG